jgi:1-phosphatidylinositol phosphodiesterase
MQRRHPDSTPLSHLNIPGTHDSATWNYSQATQDALRGITNLDGVFVEPPEVYRCQDLPLITMLNSGIRFFDLRVAYDPTNTSLVFWHSQALLSETADLSAVLFGFYKWLSDHPSETVLLSMKYETSTTQWAHNSADFQRLLYATLTSAAAKQYFDQTANELPANLGVARGKIVLFRRFALDQLPASFEAAMPGLSVASGWNDNDPDFGITYNGAKNQTVYIEDYYETSANGAAANIAQKFNATFAHLQKAASAAADSLFISFASSEHVADVPPETPQIMAIGNGTDLGVNQQLLSRLPELKGKRIGIVILDFFETPSNLVEAILRL